MTKIPPLKIQGIKSKLLPFIQENINWPQHSDKTWVEPFLGSGVVALNIKPKKAILSDINPHIIRFYQDIQNGTITHQIVSSYLKNEGAKLLLNIEHYYTIRNRFNQGPNSLDFLFLNRACFNGVMRFNRKGFFNTPSCKKPERFRGAYITKICNQVKYVEEVLKDSDWNFICQDWTKTLALVNKNCYVYLDPPYVGRTSDYFSKWDEIQANVLVDKVCNLNSAWAYSMWQQNLYRTNQQIQLFSGDDFKIVNFDHFYHVGGQEGNRNKMTEALILKVL